MRFIFEVSKLAFLIVILSIAILQYTGGNIMDDEHQAALIAGLLPAFFILGGIMIGWILAMFFSNEIDPPAPALLRGFIAGMSFGIGALILYFLRLSGTV